MSVDLNVNKIASRYVSALMDLAQEQNLIQRVESDLQSIASLFKTSDDFRRFIASPLMSREKKRDVIQALAKKMKLQPVTYNFLSVLADNKRLEILENIIETGIKEVALREGRVKAFVKTAQALTAKQAKDLTDALKKALESDVDLAFEEDPALIGGMSIQTGSIIIDDSVKSKIDRLNRQLKTGTV